MSSELERVESVVIGGGQAGLSVGYHLKRTGSDFVILDANARVGDSWRKRWDSLRLFTPARWDSLPGMPFPASPHYFPTKDEMAEYLASYASRFELPIRNGVRVDRLSRGEGGYLVEYEGGRIHAENVVVAMANHQQPRRPAFAGELDPAITQLHSAEYRNPGQLRPGRVLLVGAGNSAAEIAKELAPHHPVWMSGRDTGTIPFRVDGPLGRHLLVRLTLRVFFLRVMSISSPVGQFARSKLTGRGGPLIRVKNPELRAAGVARVPRVTGVREGLPLLEDGRTMEVENVVWCTGYRPGFERWIDLPIHGALEPRHRGGIVPGHPGLYFLGLHFLRSLASEMIHGSAEDAGFIARQVRARRGGVAQTADRAVLSRAP